MKLRPKLPSPKTVAKIVVHALFWPWNLCFLAIIAFGYVPLALVDLVIDAVDGLARWDFVAGSIVLVVLPLLVTIQAVRGLRKNVSDLALVFFGVELPIFFFVVARLFGFQDLSGAARLVVVALIAGGLAALVRVMFSARVSASPVVTVVVHALLAVLVVAGSYVGLLLALWTVPTFVDGVVELVSDALHPFRYRSFSAESFFVMLAAVVPMLWGVITIVVFLALPIVAPLTWARLLWRSGQAVSGAWSPSTAAAATVVPAVVVVTAFVLLLPQPHEDTMRRLRDPITTDAQRQELLDDRDRLRAGLLDAYLARYRYLSSDTEAHRYNPWARAWRPLVGSDAADDVAAFVFAAGRPFVFQGTSDDVRAAADAYRAFFGRHIERDNATEIKDALAATWSRQERYAGFINEGERRVRLVRQDVSTKAQDGVVDVEVHDEWTNLTPQDAEVALFFELPETAAITGLWLSHDGKKEDAFAFVVAPRGAAQQVYNEQVRQRRDPALLEQVGPRQYRLRVFPVPAKHIDRDHGRFLPTSPDGWRNADNQPRQHVWMTYQALVQVDDDGAGTVPLPRLSERRNGFWDDETRRFVNGESVEAIDGDADGGWVQGRVAAQPSASVTASSDSACFVFARKAAPEVTLGGQVVDVVIDRSLAMEPQRAALTQALSALQKTGATLRYVLGTSPIRQEAASALPDGAVVDPRTLLFFGAASAKDLVRQYLEVRPARADRVVILTAQGSFDVADDAPLPEGLVLPPTVIVHLGGALPAGYDDATIDAIRRSGGTAVAHIDEALARLAGRAYVDGVLIEPCAAAPSTATAVGSKLLARQQILAADRGGKPDAAALDVLHAVARQAGVVTPYSSMICLVDEAQRQRLKQLEEQQDRFDREVEAGAKVEGAQVPFLNSGVPEPHEWLLLLLGAVAVVVMIRRRSLLRGGQRLA